MSGISLKERSGSGKMIPSWMRFKGDLFNGWEEDGKPKEVLDKCKTDEQKAEEWKKQVEKWYGLK